MHTRPAKILLVIGIVLVVGAAAFRTFAVPKLEKYPADIDKPLQYTGTYTSYVDDATLLPLKTPLVLPFTLDRRLTVVKTTASTAVIREHIVFHRQGLPDLTQDNQYVLDRYTMRLEGGPDSWALTPSNQVDRSGTYRVQLPLGTHAGGRYPVWNNETSASSLLVDPSAVHRHDAANVDVITFSGSLDHPVTAAYTTWLAQNGFPTSISSDQVQAQLRAQGVDVGAAFAAVGPLMTPAETRTLSGALGKPIPLHYWFVYNGQVSIEPRTGTIIDVHSQREGLAVEPDLSGVAALKPILAKYASIPAVKAVSDGLDRLASRPPQLAAMFSFQQTPASSASVGADAAEQIRMMNLLELRAPWVVGVVGVLVIVVDVLLAIRRRRRHVPAELVIPDDLALPPEREPVGASSGGGAS